MVVIVGAGLAGLASATRLEEAGIDWMLVEASSGPGGRVSTEITSEGYRLDAGFQVLLDSSPTARRLLDFEALQPRYFQSGALLVDAKGAWERVLNPLFHPKSFSSLLYGTPFSLREKIVFGAYAAWQLLQSENASSGRETGRSTLEELQMFGLDGAILERFLRPFFAGVFLDNDLGTDSSVFRYDLKKFALGKALLPSRGMGEIPRQLASRLRAEHQRYGSQVTALRKSGDRVTGIELVGQEPIECSKVILATTEEVSRRLLGLPLAAGREMLGVTTLYFTGEKPLYEGALLVLPEGKECLVRHFADLTNIAPEYAPPGKRLLSATILNAPTDDPLVLASLAQTEIGKFLPDFANWAFLKEVRIHKALPSQRPGFHKALLPERLSENIFLAGDQITFASIESALASGIRAAEELLSRS